MVADELKLLIRAETSKAVREMKKAQKGMDRSAKSANNMVKALAKKAAAWGGAVLSVRAFVAISKQAVAAFREQEEAEAQLRGALLATGKASEGTAEELHALAAELQGVTTFGDEATIQATGLLQSLADLDKDGLKQIIPRIQDFATGMGIDLTNAAQLVGKTLSSSTNALVRYGVEIDASASKSEKLDQLTAALDSKFGGLSQEMANTASGGLTQLNNAFGDLQEIMGEQILESMGGIIGRLTDFVERTIETRQEIDRLNDALADDGGEASLESQVSTLEDMRDRARDNLAAYEEQFGSLEDLNDIQKAVVADAQKQLETANSQLAIKRQLLDFERRAAAGQEELAEHEERRKARLEAFNEAAEYANELAEARKDPVEREIESINEQIDSLAEKREVMRSTGEWDEQYQQIINDLVAERIRLQEELNDKLSSGDGGAAVELNVEDTAGPIRKLFEERRAIQREFYETEREQIERQKQDYIDAGVDRVDAEQWAQEQIREMNINTASEIVGAFQSAYGSLSGIVSAYSTLERQELEQTMAEYDERMEKLEEQHERQLEFAKARGASEQELTEIREQQEKEKEKLEEQKEKERKKAEKKAFKREKAMNIAETTMAGAQAFVQALTAGPVAGPILASAIAGMTAAQLSLISQQQYPGLASGGIVPAQGEGGGLYRLGDKNKAETVLPFDIRQAGGMGGSQVVFNGPVNAYGAGGVDELAETIDRSIRRQQKTGAIPA